MDSTTTPNSVQRANPSGQSSRSSDCHSFVLLQGENRRGSLPPMYRLGPRSPNPPVATIRRIVDGQSIQSLLSRWYFILMSAYDQIDELGPRHRLPGTFQFLRLGKTNPIWKHRSARPLSLSSRHPGPSARVFPRSSIIAIRSVRTRGDRRGPSMFEKRTSSQGVREPVGRIVSEIAPAQTCFWRKKQSLFNIGPVIRLAGCATH